MYRAVGEGDVPIFVLPRAGVLQPVLVVTLVIVFARMGAARFGAREGGMGDDHRLIREIGKLQRGDQRDIPQERVVVDRDTLERVTQSRQLVQSLLQDVAAPEHAEARLHRLLHLRPDLAGLVAALAVADPIEALQRARLQMTVCLAHARSRLDYIRCPQRCRAPKHDEVEKTIRAEAIRAMNRDARRLANRQ